MTRSSRMRRGPCGKPRGLVPRRRRRRDAACVVAAGDGRPNTARATAASSVRRSHGRSDKSTKRPRPLAARHDTCRLTSTRARPILQHIRQAAHSRWRCRRRGARMRRPRVSWRRPACCWNLLPVVGDHSSVSVFVALIGASGVGKSTARGLAAELMPYDGDDVASIVVGSGEGLVEAYFDMVTEVVDGKTVHRKSQTCTGVIAVLDEGQALADLGSRKGSTLLPVLRTMWSGGDTGAANASAETKRHLAGAVVQPLRPHRRLPAGQDGRTARRHRGRHAAAIHLPVRAGPVAARRVADVAAGPSTTSPRPPSTGGLGRSMSIEAAIAVEWQQQRTALTRGELTVDALDSHAGLARLKIAAGLALLNDRTHVGLDDWALAQVVMTTSSAVRSSVLSARLRGGAEARDGEHGQSGATRAGLATSRVEHIIERAACRVAVSRAQGGSAQPCPKRGRPSPTATAARSPATTSSTTASGCTGSRETATPSGPAPRCRHDRPARIVYVYTYTTLRLWTSQVIEVCM